MPLPSAGGIATSSLTGQAIGGALAVIYLAFHPVISPANNVTPQDLQDALTIVFTMGASGLFMMGHVMISLVLSHFKQGGS
jgi:hypothetical protein